MLLLPFTHENMEARRWPWATILLIVVNFVCLATTMVAERSYQRAFDAKADALEEYWSEHPTLHAPPTLRSVGMRDGTFEGSSPRAGAREEPEPEQAQAQLDALAEDLVAFSRASPIRTWAYVPAEGGVLPLFTHQFLHAGFLHFAFNMWFLWLCACNLEDRWGRLIFVGMYLVAGVVAALAHRASEPASIVPTVGASGAVAGAMGAFLIVFARTRIRFLYIGFPRPMTFNAPAWLMLPLWLLTEIFWAVVLPPNGDGTAHFAHIGGFVFGGLFAAVFVVTGLDRRLDAVQEAKVTTSQDARILEAGKLIDEGRYVEAIAILERYLVSTPSSVDANLEVLRAATAARDLPRLARAYARLVDLYLASEAISAAVSLHAEAEQVGVADAIAIATRMHLAARLKSTDPSGAARIYKSIVTRGIGPGLVAQAHLEYVALLLARGAEVEANRTLDVLAASGAAPELRGAIAELRARFRRPTEIEL
jgi:membrane associated rhomboid family serine protease